MITLMFKIYMTNIILVKQFGLESPDGAFRFFQRVKQ